MSATELLTAWERTCREQHYGGPGCRAAGVQFGRYHTEVGANTGTHDFTLPDQAASQDCAQWKINKGRHDPIWQTPQEYHPSQGCPKPKIYAFTLVNRMAVPIRLYYLQSDGWVNSKKPMLQPGESMMEGNAYLAQDYTYKVVDEQLHTIQVFRVERDEQTIYIQPPPTSSTNNTTTTNTSIQLKKPAAVSGGWLILIVLVLMGWLVWRPKSQ